MESSGDPIGEDFEQSFQKLAHLQMNKHTNVRKDKTLAVLDDNLFGDCLAPTNFNKL